MCYLIRQRHLEAGGDAATEEPGSSRLRPRWAAALGAMLIGGLAVAAAVVVPQTAPQRNVTPVAVGPHASSALQSANATVAPAGVVEQTSVPVDDGVPTAYDANRAAMGHCSHDL